MVKNNLIAESSWDVKCFLICMGSLHYAYTHNDFFSESNKRNTKIVKRITVLFRVLFHTLKSVFKKQNLYFSSLNFEVLIVALLFSNYSKSYIFIPNVIGDITNYGKLLQYVVSRYRSKVIVSDSVTKKILSEFKVSLSPQFFTFKIPRKSQIAKLIYIVVLPAAYSHTSTKNQVNGMYEFSFDIFNLLRDRHEVYILPHPRDREYLKANYPETIEHENIKKFGDKVCYISAGSSLSLNKRYGGDYGCWVSVNGENSLPDSLKRNSDFLVDISFFLK
jgi:hypothetical protein